MKKFLPLVLFISILTTGCKIQPVVPTGVQDVKFGNIDFMKGTVSLDMGLKINNPNRISVTVHGLDLDIAIAGVPLGKVMIVDKFKIEKDTEQVYRVKVNALMTDLINGIPKLLDAIQKKQTNVQVKGWIQVGSGIFKKKFPVNINQEEVTTEQKK